MCAQPKQLLVKFSLLVSINAVQHSGADTPVEIHM